MYKIYIAPVSVYMYIVKNTHPHCLLKTFRPEASFQTMPTRASMLWALRCLCPSRPAGRCGFPTLFAVAS